MNISRKYQCLFLPMTWVGLVMEPQRCPKISLPCTSDSGAFHSPSWDWHWLLAQAREGDLETLETEPQKVLVLPWKALDRTEQTSSRHPAWLCPATGAQRQKVTVFCGTYGLIRCLGTHALLPDSEVERVLHICF